MNMFTFSNEDHANRSHNSNATAAVEEYWRFPWIRIPDWQVLITFTRIYDVMVHFFVCHWLLYVKHDKMWMRRKTLLKWQSAFHMLVLKEFPPASVFCALESGKCYIEKDCVHAISSEFNMNLQTWVGYWNSAIVLMHKLACIFTFCSLMRHFTHDRVHNTRNSP
jgi:hypothetical protein